MLYQRRLWFIGALHLEKKAVVDWIYCHCRISYWELVYSSEETNYNPIDRKQWNASENIAVASVGNLQILREAATQCKHLPMFGHVILCVFQVCKYPDGPETFHVPFLFEKVR